MAKLTWEKSHNVVGECYDAYYDSVHFHIVRGDKPNWWAMVAAPMGTLHQFITTDCKLRNSFGTLYERNLHSFSTKRAAQDICERFADLMVLI